jgi:hypothetical protein
VREAADLLDKRSSHPILLFRRPGVPSEKRQEENSIAIKLIHDGLTDLRRAAYHAPFHLHRPEPDGQQGETSSIRGISTQM